MAEETIEEQKPEEEGVEVELETTEDSKEEAVEEKPTPEPEVEVEAAPEEPKDEVDEYGAKVQARIKKLTEKYRKEERDRTEAQRMAEKLLEENKKLKTQVKNLDKGYVSSEEARLESQVDALKRQYKEAYDTGDTDAMFAAQEALSKVAVVQERVRIARDRLDRDQNVEEQPQIQAALTPQPQAQPDPRAEDWASKNEWFGSDEVMTYAAFGIHKKLVEEEGFDPNSDEYYTEVDKRIRSEFPQKFQTAKKSGGAQVAPAAASATRSTAKQGRRSVKLSPSQIAMAKRLNVPLEEYAKYVKD
jgi:hypothetical protein